MADQRIAIIKNGVVINAVMAPAVSNVHLGSGETAVADAQAGPGWTYAGGVFTAPPAPVAPPKRQFTFLEFMALFTSDEQDAVVSSAVAQVRLFLFMAAGASYIDLDDPRTEPGLGVLLAAGLITSTRKAEILAGTAPA